MEQPLDLFEHAVNVVQREEALRIVRKASGESLAGKCAALPNE